MNKNIQELIKNFQYINFIPKKQYGQNFLINYNLFLNFILKNTSESLLKDIDIVEIGPGTGILTEQLLIFFKTINAIEYDKKLFKFVSIKFKNEKNIILQLGNALKYPISNYSPIDNNYFIVSNLPFNIALKWIYNLLYQVPILPKSMFLILQKEIVDKLTAYPNEKKFSAISIFFSLVYSITNKQLINSSFFYPTPSIQCYIIKCCLNKQIFLFKQQTIFLIRQIFTQKRKTILSISKLFYNIIPLQNWVKFLINYNCCSIYKRPNNLCINCWKLLNNFL